MAKRGVKCTICTLQPELREQIEHALRTRKNYSAIAREINEQTGRTFSNDHMSGHHNRCMNHHTAQPELIKEVRLLEIEAELQGVLVGEVRETRFQTVEEYDAAASYNHALRTADYLVERGLYLETKFRVGSKQHLATLEYTRRANDSRTRALQDSAAVEMANQLRKGDNQLQLTIGFEEETDETIRHGTD